MAVRAKRRVRASHARRVRRARAGGAVSAWCGIALLSLSGGGCDSRAREHVVVFAAASLTEPFARLADELEERRPDLEVDLHTAGTAQLVLQLREGAPADVFAAADEESMAAITAAGLVAEPPRVFATNRLSIVTAPGNPHAIAGLADLARGGLLVALCAPDVPAGRYARAVLARAGVTLRSASDEPSVKAVVNKVLLGELDAGVVYASDTHGLERRLEAVAIPADANVVARYPVTRTARGERSEGARAFLDLLLSEDGARVLEACGFGRP